MLRSAVQVIRPGPRRLSCAGGLLALLFLFSACGGVRPKSVLLVVVDTLRSDHLGVYGYERPTSPHLDGLATEGVIFERAISPAPWTLPAVASLLTGQLPGEHGAGGRMVGRRTALRSTSTTLAEALRERSFRTGAIVNNPFLREEFGLARGFETYDYEQGRQASAVVELARDWIQERRDQPFFLFLHLMDPHLPYKPPEEYRGRFATNGVDFTMLTVPKMRRRAQRLGPEIWEFLMARYDEEVAYVDDALRELFSWLREEGLWADTLVVVTSDHGEEFLDHGSFEHGHSMYQEVLKVPLLVWGPGIKPRRSDHPVSLVDLPPTILEAVGEKAQEEVQGTSLWPLLRGRRPGEGGLLFAEAMLYGRERKVAIDWPWKLEYRVKKDREILFDLDSDPLEQQDLSQASSSQAERLKLQLLERLLAPSRAAEPGATVELEDEVKTELQALGYLQ